MFRSIGKSKIAILLAILFGISLFFFRGGSRYSNIFNSDNVVANISGTPISTTKFNRTLQMNINQFNQMLGQKMTGDQIRSLQIHSLALGALINDAIFENEFDDKNFIIDESIIALNTKEKIPQLYDENNKLNESFLNQFLQQQQLKIDDIVQIIDFETRNEIFNSALFKINYPAKFASKIFQYENHKRIIKYIEIPIAEINIEHVLNDNEFSIDKALNDFYVNNTEKYMSSEKRNIEYIIVDKKDYLDKFIPSDYEISEYFNENKELFFKKEKRSFIQFNFKDLNEAKKFKDNIFNLNSADLIKEYASLNDVKYNSFEDLYYEDALEEISKVLFSLEINQQSEIIETTLAKHVIILTNIIEASDAKLIDVKEQIKKTITEIETNNYFDDLKNNINQDILEGNTLELLTQKWELDKTQKIDQLTQDFTNFNENEKDFYSSVISNSFASKKDFINDIISLNSDIFYILNVTDIVPSEIIKYEIIKNEVDKDWKISKKIEEIQNVISQNKENTNFIEELKNIYNIEIQDLEILKNSNKLPRQMIEKIFDGKKGLNIESYDNNNMYIANIYNIIINQDKEIKKNISLHDDLRGSFGNELMQNVKISTNDNLIDAIINRY